MTRSLNRRDAAMAFLATGCLAALSPEALAQVRDAARATRRPLLTMANLNRAIPAPGARGYDAAVAEAAHDLQAYLEARFTLTEAQRSYVSGLSRVQKAQLSQALTQARSDHQRIVVQEIQNDAGKFSRVTIGAREVMLHPEEIQQQELQQQKLQQKE